MGLLSISDIAAILLFGLAATAGLIWLMARLDALRRPVPPGWMNEDDTARFLFADGILVDANLRALTLLGSAPGAEISWADLAERLTAQFPDLPQTLPDSRMATDDGFLSPAGRPQLTIEPHGDRHVVTLRRASLFELPAAGERSAPFRTLFHAATRAPCLIWQTDRAGEVLWANTAYCELAGVSDPGGAIPVLFPALNRASSATTPERVSLTLPGSERMRWFEISTVPCTRTAMHYGIYADAVVKAEVAQRNFVQTLAKTFAQLSIGLAIFDRNRQLALFNPALIDLTALPADFLSARPNLLSFFDRMRENQMMPEPKDYSSWREQIADLVLAAADDRYCDTWTLTSGLTYRVTGRPHPDGAVAFLFEDISAEISLTRRFRTEIEIGQSVIDSLDTALAVFSPTGVLSQANQRYKALWDVDPDSSFAEISVHDAIGRWQEKCHQTTAWTRLRDYVVRFGERRSWTDEITLLDGTRFRLSVTPISGGATLVCFTRSTGDRNDAARNPELMLQSGG